MPFHRPLRRRRASLELLWQLALRDFRQRYAGSILGWLWGVIHPLVLLGVYTFLFRHALGARLPQGEATDNYPLFLMAGLLPWLVFNETVSRSATCISEFSALVKRSVFPSETVPAAILLSAGAVHVLSVAALVAVAAALGHPPGPRIAVLAPSLVPLAMLSLGLGWFVAALQVYLRDTAQILSVLLVAGFWATPVFLPESMYRGPFELVLTLNPLRPAILGYRAAILDGPLPGVAELGTLWLAGLLAMAVGWLFFRRAKRGFVDIL